MKPGTSYPPARHVLAFRSLFAFVIALLIAATSVQAARTKLEPAKSRVAVTTDHGSSEAVPGEVVVADRMGRLHRAQVEQPDSPAHPTTTLFVSQGSIVLLSGEVLVAGLEAEYADEGASAPRNKRMRPARGKLLRLAAELLTWRGATRGADAVSARDKAELGRITWAALRRLEFFDIDGTLAYTSPSGRFAGRTIREFRDLLYRVSSVTSSSKSEVMLTDFQSASSTDISARYILAMDLAPRTGLVPTIRLAGAGRIMYKKTGGQWLIEGAELDVFNIDSDLLPDEFMDLKDMVVGARR